MSTQPLIDVYPVGALAELQRLARVIRGRRDLAEQFGPGPIVREHAAHAAAAVRRGWRRKSFWNGYMAEPRTWEGWRTTRCGTGWTQRRAVASLVRHAGVWNEQDGRA